MSGLHWERAWRASAGDPGVLLLAAGADRQLAVDGLQPSTVSWAVALADRDEVTPGDEVPPGDDERRMLLDRLVEVGAVAPTVPTGRAAALVHDAAGRPAAGELARRLVAHGVEIDRAPPTGLSIVLRTGDEWPEPPGGHHIGVDLTLHHTVLIGPLVLPGTSACLRCLVARTDHLWPRAPAPPEPRVSRFLGAVADLLAIQIELAAAGRSPLVNATIAWDLELGRSDRQRVYKLAGCGGCGTPWSAGRVHLPWETPAPA